MPEPPSVPPDRAFLEMPLGAIADAAREAIVMVDEQQRIVALNRAAERMFRCTARDLHSRPLAMLLPPEARAAHEEHVRSFAASGIIERPMHARGPVNGLRADGETFPAEAHISRVETAIDGRTRTFFVALLRDLTQEQALRDEVDMLVQRVRTLLEATPVAMWIADGDRISFANRAALALFGLTAEEGLVGRSVQALFEPASREAVQAQTTQALAQAAVVSPVAGRVVRADGTQREVEIASAALPDHGHTVVQMVLSDITQRQQQARDQRRLRHELRRLSASVVEMREEERRHIARELHDELGQRLSALKLELAGLRAGAAPGPDAERIAGMAGMIDDTVAAVRRIAADLRPLILDDLGLNAAIEALARNVAQRMDIAVSVRLDECDPPVDDKTSIALYRMVQEALTNVGRHARATEVRVDLHVEGPEVVLVVRDNGVGFPDRTVQHEGRYGLLGMRERAFMLGGRFTIDNPAGGGGRITVRLPLAPGGPSGDSGAGPLP